MEYLKGKKNFQVKQIHWCIHYSFLYFLICLDVASWRFQEEQSRFGLLGMSAF